MVALVQGESSAGALKYGKGASQLTKDPDELELETSSMALPQPGLKARAVIATRMKTELVTRGLTGGGRLKGSAVSSNPEFYGKA